MYCTFVRYARLRLTRLSNIAIQHCSKVVSHKKSQNESANPMYFIEGRERA